MSTATEDSDDGGVPVTRPSPEVQSAVHGACQRLFAIERDFLDAFYVCLLQLVPVLRYTAPDQGRELSDGLARSVLWAALTDDSPEVIEATFQNVGSEYLRKGFPEDGYHGAGHALVRAAREVYTADWSSELSSAWVACYSWLGAHLQEGARRAREQGVPPVASAGGPADRSGGADGFGGPPRGGQPMHLRLDELGARSGGSDPLSNGVSSRGTHFTVPVAPADRASSAGAVAVAEPVVPRSSGDPGASVAAAHGSAGPESAGAVRSAGAVPSAGTVRSTGSGGLDSSATAVARGRGGTAELTSSSDTSPSDASPSGASPIEQMGEADRRTEPGRYAVLRGADDVVGTDGPRSLEDILETLRTRYFSSNERALGAILTRVALRTGADLRAPRADQRGNPTVVANVLAVLQVMGYSLQPLPAGAGASSAASAHDAHADRRWDREPDASARGWRRAVNGLFR
jgi:hemoglobin-like flavoprotein